MWNKTQYLFLVYLVNTPKPHTSNSDPRGSVGQIYYTLKPDLDEFQRASLLVDIELRLSDALIRQQSHI